MPTIERHYYPPPTIERHYYPPPTIERFFASNAQVRGVRGPRGSGKSVGCCMEMIQRGAAQKPFNGVRSSRWAAIRATYQELKNTTIRTWTDWTGCRPRETVPITAKYNKRLQDGTVVDLEVLFVALDQPKDVSKLQSLELTGGWINEAAEVSKSVLDMLTASVGRYPPMIMGGPSWQGIILDTNPPCTEHWWYKLAEVVKPRGWEWFVQPGALIRRPDGEYRPNPDAENIQNLAEGYGYYMRLLEGKDKDWINAFILNQYAQTFTGKPVYEDFYVDTRHHSETPLEVMRGLPVYLGWDFGLTPACALLQVSPMGQIRVLREWVGEDIGTRQFAQRVVIPALQTEFAGQDLISAGDPAGAQRNQVDEASPIGELCRLGIKTTAAPAYKGGVANQFSGRRDCVIDSLVRTCGDEPAFILDPSCKTLREGFLGGYQFSRVAVAGGDRFTDQPEKNRCSHIAEALQYCMLRIEAGARQASSVVLEAPPDTEGGFV